ncbi:flagellar basal body-associated FliL family protein [uncultured Roseovarius sp.]|uniref:flagellar basal body-associated FliL family protein n=1 Tax=uncultured Roseovarius sp. TaxID=293344 RepID=UPI0026046F5B|nr:flagellar basal body-associated FliL family protein [uncultured Roseovarius sp.]
MISKLLPVFLLLIGIVAGAGAGHMLRSESDIGDDAPTETTDQVLSHGHTPPDTNPTEIVKLNNQFVVPVVDRDMIGAMVVLSLSVETGPGSASAVYEREPKLRDALLQALFDHANIGGFDGAFTNARNMDMLRASLLDVARNILGEAVQGVLITEIARQDV